jgi:hypothetical protein
MICLAEEFLVARDQLGAEHHAMLLRCGIQPAIVGREGWIGVTSVQIHGNVFEPSEDGPKAFISPVRGLGTGEIQWPSPAEVLRFGDIVDLLAWNPASPGRWALRRGSATALGIVQPQILDPAPVRVHGSPLGWFQSGGDGLALLSHQSVDVRNVLMQLRGIVADDQTHRRALIAILSRPLPVPPISIASAPRRVA